MSGSMLDTRGLEHCLACSARSSCQPTLCWELGEHSGHDKVPASPEPTPHCSAGARKAAQWHRAGGLLLLPCHAPVIVSSLLQVRSQGSLSKYMTEPCSIGVGVRRRAEFLGPGMWSQTWPFFPLCCPTAAWATLGTSATASLRCQRVSPITLHPHLVSSGYIGVLQTFRVARGPGHMCREWKKTMSFEASSVWVRIPAFH